MLLLIYWEHVKVTFCLKYCACLLSISSCMFINLGIRVQSLKKGQITMDIDLRWGGDPSIILGVEAALVASIPIQVGESRIVVEILFLYRIFVYLSMRREFNSCFDIYYSWRIFKYLLLFVSFSNLLKKFLVFLLLLLHCFLRYHFKFLTARRCIRIFEQVSFNSVCIDMI